MAKFKVAGNSEIKVDNSAGTAIAMTSYVDTVSAFGKAVDSLDVTAFSDTGEKVIAGIELGDEITLDGAYDDTASTGPDAVYGTLVGVEGTIEFAPAGTASGARKYTGEYLCLNYKVTAAVKERVSWSATHKLTGTLTVGTY